jgi:hypothetical protein
MADIITIFNAIAPQYSTDARISTFQSISQSLTSQTFFGANYEYAVALRMAHMITIANRLRGQGGAIAAESEGEVSISYSIPAKMQGALSQTSYGIELEQLIRQSGMGITVAGTIDTNSPEIPAAPGNIYRW